VQKGVQRIVAEADAFRSSTDLERSQAKTSTGLRLQFWAVSLRLAAQAPLVGGGVSSFADRYYAQAAATGGVPSRVGNPHNEYLYVVCTLGGVGLALYVAIHVALARHAVRMRNAAQRRIILIYLLVALASILFNSMVIDMIPGHFHALALLALGWFQWDDGTLPESDA